MATWFAKNGKIYIERSILLIIAVLFLLLGSQGFLSSLAPKVKAATRKYGKIKVTTYAFEGNAYPIGNVEIHVSPVNTAVPNCPDHNKVTNASGDNSATFTDCGIKLGNTSEPYQITYVKRDGYSFRSIHGPLMDHSDGQSTDQGARFNVIDGQTREISVYLNPPPSFNPGGGGGGGSSQPTENRNDPRFHKDGKVTVKSYYRNDNGQYLPQGGFTVETRPKGEPVSNSKGSDGTLLNCDPSTKITDQSPGSNYGQAHFLKCWTASSDDKEYNVFLRGRPMGFVNPTLHITSGGKFSTNQTSTSDIVNCDGCPDAGKFRPTFVVRPGSEVQLEIRTEIPPIVGEVTTIKPPPTLDSNGKPVGPPKPERPAILESNNLGTTPVYTTEEGDDTTVTYTDILNAGVSGGRLQISSLDFSALVGAASAICPDGSDPPCPPPPDTKAPKAPEGVKVSVSESGTPELSWEAVQGDPVIGEDGTQEKDDNGKPKFEEINYRVDRINNNDPNATLETIGDDLDKPSFTDDQEGSSKPVKIPGNYSYYVYARDDAEEPNLSLPTIRIVNIELQKPQVPAAQGNATPAELAGSSSSSQGKIEVKSVGDTTTILIPVGAGGDSPLACAVVNRDNTASDSANTIGEAQATVMGLSCRDEAGEEQTEADEPIEYEVEIENTLVSDDTELYAYDGTDWEEIDTDETIDEGETLDDEQFEEDTTVGKVKAGRVKGDKTKFKVKSKRILTLAIIDKYNTSPVVKIAVISSTIAALGGIGFMSYVIIMRRRIQARALHPYEDVDIRPINPRVDYTPTLTSPVQDDTRKQNDE